MVSNLVMIYDLLFSCMKNGKHFSLLCSQSHSCNWFSAVCIIKWLKFWSFMFCMWQNTINGCFWEFRNIGFPNGPVFRYGNFFIPRVEKFSYLKITAHSEIVFLYELTKQFCAAIRQNLKRTSWSKNLSNCSSLKRISTWVMWKSDFHMAKKFVK